MLCQAVLPPPKDYITVERLLGGGYNRIIGVLSTSEDNSSPREYILRVPRFPFNQIERDLAPLQLLSKQLEIPVPEVIKFDTTTENPLESPYMIQIRLPGEDLDCIYRDLSHETKCAIATKIGDVFSQLHTIRSVSAGRPTLSSNKVMLAPFYCREPDEQKLVPFKSGPTTQSVKELVHTILDSRIKQAIAKGNDPLRVKICKNMLTIASEMDELGVWGEDAYCLCHLDLTPRNIMAEEANPTHPSGISGILDWDSALFAPLLMSCTPPRWIWTWNFEGESSDDDLESLNPTPESLTAESCELKQAFETAAGPVYSRYAEGPQNRLARELHRLTFDGFRGNADFYRYEELVDKWATIQKSIRAATSADGEPQQDDTTR